MYSGVSVSDASHSGMPCQRKPLSEEGGSHVSCSAGWRMCWPHTHQVCSLTWKKNSPCILSFFFFFFFKQFIFHWGPILLLWVSWPTNNSHQDLSIFTFWSLSLLGCCLLCCRQCVRVFLTVIRWCAVPAFLPWGSSLNIYRWASTHITAT